MFSAILSAPPREKSPLLNSPKSKTHGVARLHQTAGIDGLATVPAMGGPIKGDAQPHEGWLLTIVRATAFMRTWHARDGSRCPPGAAPPGIGIAEQGSGFRPIYRPEICWRKRP